MLEFSKIQQIFFELNTSPISVLRVSTLICVRHKYAHLREVYEPHSYRGKQISYFFYIPYY